MPISLATGVDTREPATRDAEAVAAVLRGETLNYRELVERYQRLVYAVTWSCLGDATLAEDAAQEAFIRAYRSLPLLGNGAKFSAWVTTIARNTAISLGLKQRRELANRTRWALEQPASEPPAAMAEEAWPPEMLRQALAELSAEHRESLVLFYLEGKRGAEAAAALGISEAALRMRLLRARAALRERLEARLGESLAQLQPSRSLTPGVMGVVLSSSTAKAGGATTMGTALLTALGKVLPFKIALAFVPIAAVWGVAGAWSSRRELQWLERNLRDPNEDRAKFFHKQIQKISWMDLFKANVRMPVFIGVICVALNIIGDRIFGLILAAILLALLVKMARLLPINRGIDLYWTIALLLMTISSVLLGAFAPHGEHVTVWYRLFEAYLVWKAMIRVEVISDMRSNLFLLEQDGLLPASRESAVAGNVEERLSSAQLLAFARFLGELSWVDDYRWVRQGEELMLKAGPLPSSPLLAPVNFLLPALRWRQWSWIGLKADGTVSTHCSEDGARQAGEDVEQKIEGIGALERRVASAVEAAWRNFRAGDIAQAERAIGVVQVEDVLLALPAPGLTGVGLLKAVVVGVGIFMVGMLGVVLAASSNDRIVAAFVMFKLSGMLLGVLVVLMVLKAILNKASKK